MSIVGAFMVPHPPLIVPEVGKGGEQQIESTSKSYKEVAKQIKELKPDTIIISSPHSTIFADYIHISPGKKAIGSFSTFGAPNITFEEEYDDELVTEIENICNKENFPAGTFGEKNTELDHGTMVPLYFIEQEYKDFKLIRLGISNLPLVDHYHMGQIINEAVEKLDRRVVYVASGDLSHKLQDYGPYGFIEEGPIYDKRIMDTCSNAKFNELLEYDEEFLDKAAECGHRSFVIMAGALDGLNVEAKELNHEDVTGVGYGICTFYPKEENKDRLFRDKYLEKVKNNMNTNDDYINLARETINNYIKYNKIIEIPDNTKEELLNKKAGVFVSIHKFGMLRGCIGTIIPTTDCIAKEIINNAISASTKDPRFEPITEEELPYLEINVDELGEIEDISSKEELDVKKYGVIVSSGFKRGLLLPDLDGVDTIDEQISIARSKGGISPSDDIKLQRFEVIRHK